MSHCGEANCESIQSMPISFEDTHTLTCVCLSLMCIDQLDLTGSVTDNFLKARYYHLFELIHVRMEWCDYLRFAILSLWMPILHFHLSPI